jgi:uracil-DNA glycosylase family 4
VSLPKPKFCESCVGYQWGRCKGYSRISGSNRIPLLIVGEASGAAEERQGEPFVGPSGELLERALHLSGLKREDYSITNCIRCRPPNNFLKGAPYEREALDYCRYYLDQVVEERKPSLILALGDVALRELSMLGGSISELRGFVLPSRYNIPLIAAYHPAHLIPRKDSPGAMHLLGVLLHDLRRAESYARNGVPPPLETHYDLQPSRTAVLSYLGRLGREPQLPVAYDIETASILGEGEPEDWREKRIIQIQFSSGAGEALVLPLQPPYMDLIDQILRTPNMKWGWNDRLSDRLALRAQGFQLNGELHDLMNAWAHLQPGFMSGKDETNGDKGVPAKLMSLQSCVSFYFPNEGPWKGSVGRAIDRFAWGRGMFRVMEELRYYGARDADLTFRVGEKLFASLQKLELW